MLFNFLTGKAAEQVRAIVEIYTWQTCPYCIRAKLLLRWKGVAFTEYKIDGNGAARVKMAERAHGRRTVPQIFINNVPIGGCDDLYALDRSGQLDGLLRSPAEG
ncbi:MAG: glutaredoxin 3 [Alkalinema sp. CACIAM 70d]|nr:MAG: glutaredoxin 3 [Alkalinema sp. CACIAM 70d]